MVVRWRMIGVADGGKIGSGWEGDGGRTGTGEGTDAALVDGAVLMLATGIAFFLKLNFALG